MNEAPDELRRENAYLKQRCAQLQGDATDLAAENLRLRQELERVSARRATAQPNPLAGGQ
jgi:prefoldin subunit 5